MLKPRDYSVANLKVKSPTPAPVDPMENVRFVSSELAPLRYQPRLQTPYGTTTYTSSRRRLADVINVSAPSTKIHATSETDSSIGKMRLLFSDSQLNDCLRYFDNALYHDCIPPPRSPYTYSIPGWSVL